MQQQQTTTPPPGGHQMGPMGAGPPPASITTEQIQKYLDENKQLILAILDNQNLGRLAECAQYQAQLQKNLLYLAAIADAQPQAPAMRPQMIPHPHAAMAQGGSPYMQQAPIFSPKTPMQFTPQQIQELQQQQQQQQLHHHPQMMPFPAQMGMRPVSLLNGMHAAQQAEPSRGGGSNEVLSGAVGMSEPPRGSTLSSSADGQAGKQDAGSGGSEHGGAATAVAADNSQKNLANEQGTGEPEPSSNPERSEDTKTP